jgi:hypothetical protein
MDNSIDTGSNQLWRCSQRAGQSHRIKLSGMKDKVPLSIQAPERFSGVTCDAI